MLLRMKVKGFRNLRDVEIRFGPLTCFVGPNGVGKSNIFDAIHFLKELADKDIQSAAQSVRSPAKGEFGPRDLFFDGDVRNPISFEVDMIVPDQVTDDFGREAHPATSLLRYEVAFTYHDDGYPRLVLNKEELGPLRAGEAKAHIGFPHTTAFRKSVVKPTPRKGNFISTKHDGDDIVLTLHQDGGSRGQGIPPGRSPRTVVGGTNAAEYPTVLAAKREMASWRTLHLEPSVMRTPDKIGGPTAVDAHGGHVAAALARLVSNEKRRGSTLADVSNSLARLVPDIESIEIDRDESRQQLTTIARMKGCRQTLGPRSLSDGTLRFLALVTMEADRQSASVLCMEEPENGMHPKRIPAMVNLLREFTTDADDEVDAENPLRQVILNTHSPDVVKQLHSHEDLFVETLDTPSGKVARVCSIEGGWRTEGPMLSKGHLWDFIGGSPYGEGLQLELDLERKNGTHGC